MAFTTILNKPSYNGYYSNFLGADIEESLESVQTASLAQKLGYTQSEEEVVTYKLGQMADEKNVSEAIVLIPYLEKPIIHRRVEGPDFDDEIEAGNVRHSMLIIIKIQIPLNYL